MLEKQLQEKSDEHETNVKEHEQRVRYAATHAIIVLDIYSEYLMYRDLVSQLECARKETAQFRQSEREHQAEITRLEDESKIGIKKK